MNGIVQPAAQAGEGIVRVVVCDDSVVIRAAISRILEQDKAIRVVARVADGQRALAALAEHAPDVLVLDIEMPVMDGLTALPLLLEAAPGLPVLMASTLTTRGAEVTLRALRLGAADYVPKPSATALADNEAFQRELTGKVKALARRRRVRLSGASDGARSALRPAPRLKPRLLAIGSSTGGPQALFSLLPALGRDLPLPVVLTQHMPAAFTPILAEHIARLCPLPCAEACDGEALRAGCIHLAPGNRHLLVQVQDGQLIARLSDTPAENYCRPSVDPMLRSAAGATQGRTLAVMLTGMGQDGLSGTRHLIEAGGTAIAQDEASSIVWGMPGAIARAGLCHAVLPLEGIAPHIRALLRGTPC